MKKHNPSVTITPPRELTEDEIRDYAFHLYQQSGCIPGHDLDHWLEAKACLEANVSPQHTRVRLHRQRHDVSRSEATVVALPPPKEEPSPAPAEAGRGETGAKELPGRAGLQ